MTAALHDRNAELTWIDLSSSPALGLRPRLVDPLPAQARLRVVPTPRGQLVVVPYRRRRAIAAVTAVLVALALVLAVVRLTTGSTSPTSADAPSAAGVAAPQSYTVRTGDTLWSIAADVAPDVDVRITVDRLVRLNGPAPIVTGQQLDLP